MLPGFETTPSTDRLFFAVFPEPAAADRIAALAQALRQQHGLRGKPLPAARLHVTLHHLGDYAGLPADLIAKAKEVAARVTMPVFEVAFGSASSFGGGRRQRPLVLRGEEDLTPLLSLQRALGEAMTAAGLGRHVTRKFVPHATLLYDDRVLAPRPVMRIAWTAREFTLVHSLIGRGEYRVLGRWPLATPE